MANLDVYKGTILDKAYSPMEDAAIAAEQQRAAALGGMMGRTPAGGFNNPGGTTYYPSDGSYAYGANGAYGPKTAGVAYPASGYTPPIVPGQSDLTFGAGNPLQAQYPAVASSSPYQNPAWGATQPQPKPPVNLTVTGKGTPYSNPGWGAGTLAQLIASIGQQQGANPGMEGNGAFGSTPMSPGIPAQLPPADGSVGLPKWKGAAVKPPPTTFAGSSTGKQYNIGQTYSSGGYLFQMTPNGPKQVGRDPRGVIPQSYQGTPQAMAAAQRRERLTGGDGMDRSAAGSDSNSKFESTAISRANAARK